MFTKTFVVAALAALRLQPVFAGDWWIIGYQQNYCNDVDSGDTDYNWKGTDGNCHNFGDSDDGCVFGTMASNGDGSAVDCGAKGQPESVYSMEYFEGEGNSGAGCLFFTERDCQGTLTEVTDSDEIDHCYEFNSAVKSFECR